MVHYLHLSEIGEDYGTEEGDEGHRRELGGGIEALYGRFIAARDAALQRSNAAGDLSAKVQAKAEYMDFVRKIERLKKRYERQLYFFRDDGTIDWGRSAKTVVYDNDPRLRDMTRIRLVGGRFYTGDPPHGAPLDTSGMTTAKSGNGWAIYVMSAEGSIHVSSHVVGHRHHSSLLAGEDVAAAGELKVRKGGFLEAISNKTGHYHAKIAHFIQMLHQLEKSQVHLESVTIRHMYYIPGVREEQVDTYAGIQAFRQHLLASSFATELGVDATDYEYAKLLAYLPALPKHQFDAMAAEVDWRWVTDAEFNAGQRGVVRMSDGSAIPHKWVRRWLKGRGIRAQPAVQSGLGR